MVNQRSADSQSLKLDQKANMSRQHDKKQRLDWAKFTDFRSRNTKDDLARLCSSLNPSQRRDVFETCDQTGLYPIHWAAIHNRSDMIEYMLDNGSCSRKPCKSKFLANGTPLHLAALNGSLEAAVVLLEKGGHKENGGRYSKEKKNNPKEAKRDDKKSNDKNIVDYLKIRDSEGQTALMRAAAPKSKRMDLVLDLLRKNLWSLSARPAEMALYFISMGSDWRETEPINGMNLLHLAIINDYDDIVNLLLVVDKKLLDTIVKLPETTDLRRKSSIEARKRQETTMPKQIDSDASSFETISLNSARTRTTSATTSSNESISSNTSATSSPISNSSNEINEPLIDRNGERANDLLNKGVSALELAILYGRVAMIGLIWNAKANEELQATHTEVRPLDRSRVKPENGLEAQRKAIKQHSDSGHRLKQIIFKACWNNKEELARLFRVALLKCALALDMILLALIWTPINAGTRDDRRVVVGLRGGVFILSYCLTIALAFRTMIKNPAYLRRNSVQYFNEMAQILSSKTKNNSSNRRSSKNPPGVAKSVPKQEQSDLNLIDLEANLEDENQSRASNKSQTIKTTSDNQANQSSSLKTVQNKIDDQSRAKKLNQWAVGESLKVSSWHQYTFSDKLRDRIRLLCHKCRCIRRPRSKHCNYCNHCVQDFDHHCIYLGCCIGRNNRLDFLLTMIALAITGLYGSVVYLTTINRAEWSAFWHFIGLVWISKYVFIGGVTAFLNLRRACLNVTLFEEIRSKRIRKIFGPDGPPDAISRSHKAFATLKGSFWRYSPDRFLTGDLQMRKIFNNLREFSNFITYDEYLLTVICTDTPLTRSLTSSDSRVNMYKFA